MQRSLAALLVWGETSRFSDAGFEGTTIGDVRVIDGASRDLVERLWEPVQRLCEPCGSRVAGEKLTELRALTVTRARADIDSEFTGAAYTARLAQYPADVAIAACDAWANREEFWPSWAELKAECDKRMRGRLQIRDALQKALGA